MHSPLEGKDNGMRPRHVVPPAGFLAVLVTALLIGPAAAAESVPAGPNAATVNGIAIPVRELEDAVHYLQQRPKAPGQTAPNDAAALRVRALDTLIDRELLFQASQKQQMAVDPAEIEKRLAALRNRYPDNKAFAAALAKVNLTPEKMRQRIEQALAIQQLIKAEIDPQLVIPEEETRAFYEAHKTNFDVPEQVQARHILVKVAQDANEADKQKARQRIAEIQDKIAAGEDFAELAKTYSDGPSAVKGGDLGYFRRGKMVPSFDEAAFGLDAGEVSGLVETRFGYHLIKVTDRRAAGVIPFHEARPGIEAHLKQQLTPGLVDQLVQRLRDQATIERF
jgi:peptidyl-prolyl cis-trans isomerase C